MGWVADAVVRSMHPSSVHGVGFVETSASKVSISNGCHRQSLQCRTYLLRFLGPRLLDELAVTQSTHCFGTLDVGDLRGPEIKGTELGNHM